MKKSIIIAVVIIAVVAIAYFVFFKKDENTDNNSETNGNSSDESKTIGSAITSQLKSEVATESVLDAVGTDTEVTEQISYLIGLSDGEKADYKKYVEYIKTKTGQDYSGKSFDTVKAYFEEVQEMVELADKINSVFGVDVDLTSSKSNELKEVQAVYNENDSLLKEAAKSYGLKFIEQFTTANAYNRTTKKNYHELDSYKGWDTNVMNGLLTLPKEYATIANDTVKTNWNGSYKLEPKKQKWGKSESDAPTTNMNGKSIVQALKSSSFMLKGRDAKTSPQGLGQNVIDLYTNTYLL